MIETPENRSRIMRAVKGSDTAPEMAVRRLVHKMGYRFRLRRKDLPGTPDLVFPRLHKAVFVHGCFWHGHDCVRGARVPVQNRDYWTQKVERNKKRDEHAQTALKEQGWQPLVIWECETRNEEGLQECVEKFLRGLSMLPQLEVKTTRSKFTPPSKQP